jgi:hypothetical protein
MRLSTMASFDTAKKMEGGRLQAITSYAVILNRDSYTTKNLSAIIRGVYMDT